MQNESDLKFKLDKSKCYCYSCFKEGKITELLRENLNLLSYSNCGHEGSWFFRLQWCDKCNDFTPHRGLSLKNGCKICNSKKSNYHKVLAKVFCDNLITKSSLNRNDIDKEIFKGKNWYIIPPSQEDLEKLNNENKRHISYTKECIVCKSLFYYGQSQLKTCGLCKIHIFNSCSQCGNDAEILIHWNNGLSNQANIKILETIENNEEYHAFCSQKCLANNNSDKWRATEKFQEFIRSSDFHTDYANQLSSDRMKKYIRSDKGQEHIKNHARDITPKLKYCKICKKETIHWSKFCSKCYPNVAGTASGLWRQWNKNIECNNNCPYLNECTEKEKSLLKNYLGYCENAIHNFDVSGIVFLNGWWEFNENISCNSNCIMINNCNHKNDLKK